MWPVAWDKISEILFAGLINAVFAIVLALVVKRWLFEYQTRFARLHEERAKVIAELYRRLVRAQNNLSSMMNLMKDEGSPTILSITNIAAREIQAFRDYFDENRIYLSKNLREKLGVLHTEFGALWLLLAVSQEVPSEDDDAEMKILKSVDAVKIALRRLADVIPTIVQDIEKEFRAVLGDTNEADNLP